MNGYAQMASQNDVIRLSDVRRILTSLGVRPRKSLGQNFLVDRNVVERILEAADVSENDVVLEIGPGLGALTYGLVERASSVVAVEADKRLSSYLEQRFHGSSGIRLIHADVLDLDLDALLQHQGMSVGKVISNLPYASGSRILVSILRAQRIPDAITVTVQREVADRLVSEPGGKDYGLLGVWAQRLYDVVLKRMVGAKCFWPEPDVRSSVVVFRKHNRLPLNEASEKLFYRLTKKAFSHRRKQLASILANEKGKLHLSRARTKEMLAELNKPETTRPEGLDPADWCRVTTFLVERG